MNGKKALAAIIIVYITLVIVTCCCSLTLLSIYANTNTDSSFSQTEVIAMIRKKFPEDFLKVNEDANYQSVSGGKTQYIAFLVNNTNQYLSGAYCYRIDLQSGNISRNGVFNKTLKTQSYNSDMEHCNFTSIQLPSPLIEE